MKIATQNQAFFPPAIMEKFEYIKAMGFDGYEIDGRLLVENLDEVKAAIKATAPAGHDGLWRVTMSWIRGFYRRTRALNGLQQIGRILEALAARGRRGDYRPGCLGDVYLPSAANDFAT